MKLKLKLAAACCAAVLASPAVSENLSLAYFMGSNHPMNKSFLTPMGEMIEKETGGEVTIQHFAGGALNGVPSKQYSILLDSVADIVFMTPSAQSRLFPKTATISLPNMCETAAECTTILRAAQSEIETEFRGKIVGLWTASPPVLITRDKAVRTLEDVKGMKIRVPDPTAIPFVEALGASAIAVPVTELNQSLANGVIDAVMIDPSGILSFKLDEPGNYVTTWFAGGAPTFLVLMNQGTYDGLSDAGKAAVDKVAASDLSMQSAEMYWNIGRKGLEHAKTQGLEIIDFTPEDRAKIDAVVEDVMAQIADDDAGDKTIGDIVALMRGQ